MVPRAVRGCGAGMVGLGGENPVPAAPSPGLETAEVKALRAPECAPLGAGAAWAARALLNGVREGWKCSQVHLCQAPDLLKGNEDCRGQAHRPARTASVLLLGTGWRGVEVLHSLGHKH